MNVFGWQRSNNTQMVRFPVIRVRHLQTELASWRPLLDSCDFSVTPAACRNVGNDQISAAK